VGERERVASLEIFSVCRHTSKENVPSAVFPDQTLEGGASLTVLASIQRYEPFHNLFKDILFMEVNVCLHSS
jgi:hypothetical protein